MGHCHNAMLVSVKQNDLLLSTKLMLGYATIFPYIKMLKESIFT